MSVNASIVLNDVNIKRGREGVQVRRTGSITPGNEITLFESDNALTIEYMEWSTNSLDAGLSLMHRKSDDTYESVGILRSDGSNVIAISPASLIEESSSLFIINSFKEGAYKFTLRNKIHFPNGLKVVIRNNNYDEEINNAIRLFGVSG